MFKWLSNFFKSSVNNQITDSITVSTPIFSTTVPANKAVKGKSKSAAKTKKKASAKKSK